MLAFKDQRQQSSSIHPGRRVADSVESLNSSLDEQDKTRRLASSATETFGEAARRVIAMAKT